MKVALKQALELFKLVVSSGPVTRKGDAFKLSL